MKTAPSPKALNSNKQNKILSKLSIEGNFFNMIKILTKTKQNKNAFSKQTWSEMLKAFSLRSGPRQGEQLWDNGCVLFVDLGNDFVYAYSSNTLSSSFYVLCTIWNIC